MQTETTNKQNVKTRTTYENDMDHIATYLNYRINVVGPEEKKGRS